MILFLLAILSASASAEIQGDRYHDPVSGFAIEKPKDWAFVQKPKAHGLQLKDESVMRAEDKTVVTFAKDMGKTFFGVKPTVGVEILKLPPKTTPVEWLKEEMKRQEEHDKYFHAASSALPTTIDEVATAARAAFVNSTVISGQEVKVYHVIYVVPSGRKVYLINMNCNEGLAQDYVGVFGKIADTISARKSNEP